MVRTVCATLAFLISVYGVPASAPAGDPDMRPAPAPWDRGNTREVRAGTVVKGWTYDRVWEAAVETAFSNDPLPLRWREFQGDRSQGRVTSGPTDIIIAPMPDSANAYAVWIESLRREGYDPNPDKETAQRILREFLDRLDAHDLAP